MNTNKYQPLSNDKNMSFGKSCGTSTIIYHMHHFFQIFFGQTCVIKPGIRLHYGNYI